MDMQKNSITKNHTEEYTTLTDGTDISELAYEYRQYIYHNNISEILQFDYTSKALGKLYEMYEEEQGFPICVGDYLFTSNLNRYYGYVLQIRNHQIGKVTYKYLDMVVGKAIKTIRYNPKDYKDSVTRAITDTYGIYFEEKMFFERLVRFEVKNKRDALGRIVFSEITKFVFIKPEAEKALMECSGLLIKKAKQNQS